MIKVATEKNQAIKSILNIKVQTKSAGHSGLYYLYFIANIRTCYCILRSSGAIYFYNSMFILA